MDSATSARFFTTVDGMPNRSGRARHLTLVPDIPTLTDGPARFDDAYVDGFEVPAGIVQLTLDVTLSSGFPAAWRRIRVRSDLLLPEFHAMIQAAMGWGGRDHYLITTHAGSSAHTFCTPSMLAVGEVGQLGSHVRIDTLLSSPGDTIQYRYDHWVHVIRVQSVDTDVDDLRPACLDGDQVCPPEVGFEQLAANPRPREESRETTIEAASLRLRHAWRSRSPEAESAAASPAVATLFRRVLEQPVPHLLDLLPRCELTIESSVDLPVARAAMAKVAWFLQLVGNRGVRLTDDGRLPPPVVEAVRDNLDWGIGWVGSSVRESDHHQATDLREAVRSLGLVRVLKGTLVCTKAGSLLADDSIGLWHHCAARLPLGKQDYELDSGTLYLVALAASASAEQRDAMVVQTMNALGWGGGECNAFDTQKLAHPTVAFLDLIGAHGPLFYLGGGGTDSPSWARRFARDALRTVK